MYIVFIHYKINVVIIKLHSLYKTLIIKKNKKNVELCFK